MYGIEMIFAAILCICFSGFVFFIAQRSWNQTDVFVSMEEIKPKTKVIKKSNKLKIAKKETGLKIVQKVEQEIQTTNSQKSSKKNKQEKKQLATKQTLQPAEMPSVEPNIEWQKVMKISKKGNKNELKEETVVEEVTVDPEIIVTNYVPVSQFSPKKEAKGKKAKKPNVQDFSIDDSKIKNAKKEVVVETEIHPEHNIKQSKEKILIDEPKTRTYKGDTDTTIRINELIFELETVISKKAEESKANSQTIKQLNKEIDSLKQQIKVSQSTEEKLTEELRKKNSSFNDIKQQFVIVQSELTKSIVQTQSLRREKDKLEGRLMGLEEPHRLLTEKSAKFDEICSERDNLSRKLVTVEEEYMITKTRSDKLSKEKEVESSEKIMQLQTDRQRMQEQLVRVQGDLIENNSKLQNMQQELLCTKTTCTDLMNENMRLQKSCSTSDSMNALVKEQQTEIATNSILLEQKNNKIVAVLEELEQLKVVNEKLVEERESLIKQCETLSPGLGSEDAYKEKIESLVLDLDYTKQLLSKSDCELYSEARKNESLITQLNEITDEKQDLVLLVEKYKTGLESTESILSNLQISVNEEEGKWRDSLLKAEHEAEKCKKELEKAYNDLSRIKNFRSGKNELNFTYQCVDKSLSSLIDEMEARMNNFDASLEAAIQERDSAISQIQVAQTNGNINNDQTHLINNSNECEMLKIKEDLSNQVEQNRSLEMHCNKYQSLVDAGKEALEAEKVQVKFLQEELKLLQSKLSVNDNQDL